MVEVKRKELEKFLLEKKGVSTQFHYVAGVIGIAQF